MPRLDRERWRLPRRGLLARWAYLFAEFTGGTGFARVGRTTRWQGSKRRTTIRRALKRPSLLARPGQPTETASPVCTRQVDRHRDALLFVPAGYRADQPAPFVLSCTGPGRRDLGSLSATRSRRSGRADPALARVAPANMGTSFAGAMATDVAFIDRALTAAFARCAVDPDRLAVAGFSDGARTPCHLASRTATSSST